MLTELLGSKTRARVLTLLLARPRREYYVRELIGTVGGSASGVQRELARLEALGVVSSTHTAGRRIVSIVDGHELLPALQSLVDAETQRPTLRAAGGDAAGIAARLNPRLRDALPAIVAACMAAGVEYAVVFGSASDPDPAVAPRDLDVMVRLGGAAAGRAARYFALRSALETATGLPVHLLEEQANRNPFLSAEIERSGVVVFETLRDAVS